MYIGVNLLNWHITYIYIYIYISSGATFQYINRANTSLVSILKKGNTSLYQKMYAIITVISLFGAIALRVGGTLGLVLGNTSAGTADLEALVLGLLDGLAGLLGAGLDALADEAVLGLELAEGVFVVVDEAEAGGLATTELGAEAEHDGELGIGLVHAANNLGELVLGNIGTAGVDDIDNHLF